MLALTGTPSCWVVADVGVSADCRFYGCFTLNCFPSAYSKRRQYCEVVRRNRRDCDAMPETLISAMKESTMSKKFHGSYAELRRQVSQTGATGEWLEMPNQMQFRACNGAILNWWELTRTISFQGSPLPAKQLEVLFSRQQIEDDGRSCNKASIGATLESWRLKEKCEGPDDEDGKVSCNELLDDLRVDAVIVHGKIREMLDMLKQLAEIVPKR